MDLHFGDSKPTDDERAAVDALLGPPESAWEGAADRSDADLRWARGGRRRRDRRDQLLPGLHAVNDRVGWISEGALDYLCRRLTVPPAEAYGVATFYAMFSVRPRPATVLHVCTDLACAAPRLGGRARGPDRAPGPGAAPRPRARSGARAPAWACASEPRRRWLLRAGDDPAVRRLATNRSRRGSRPDGVWGEFERAGARGRSRRTSPTADATPLLRRDRPRHRPPPSSQPPAAPESAPAGAPGRRSRPPGRRPRPRCSCTRIGTVDPASLDDYRAHGGYTALRRAFATRPRRGHPRGHRLRAGRPRRRRLPHGPQVAGHRPAARPPALPRLQRRREPSPAPSRTGCSWRATRTRWSRR